MSWLGRFFNSKPKPTPAPPPPPPVPVLPPLSHLHAEDQHFVNEQGERVAWAMMDGFRDFERFLRGEDISAQLQQAASLGAMGRRVFGTMKNIADLDPIDYGEQYYYAVQPFCQLLLKYRLYVQWTVFADAGLLKGGPSWQLAHYNRLVDLLCAMPNAVLELVNENDSNDNRIDLNTFPKPDGICCSRGSNGAGANPPIPPWDYADLHCERRADRPATTTTTVYYAIRGYHGEGGDPDFPGTRVATVNSEPQGFREDPDGRRITDPETAWLMGIGCGYGAGGTAHCDSGIQSVVLGPNEAECVRRFLRGVRAVCS